MACISAPPLVHPILLMGKVVQLGAYALRLRASPQKIIADIAPTAAVILYATQHAPSPATDASPYTAATGQLS